MALKKVLLFLLFLGAVIEISSLSKKDDSNNLSLISDKDQLLLEQFLREVLYEERLIYVLCGSKPMGTCAYLSSPIEETSHNKKIREGWKVWCRYQHLFPSQKLFIKSIGDEDRENYITLLFLHKPHFKDTLENHRKIFEKYLGDNINTDEMLTRFELDADPFKSVLKNNHALIGILFGFGVQNSFAFQKKCDEDPYPEQEIQLFSITPNDQGIVNALVARNHLFVGEKKLHSLNFKESHQHNIELFERIERSCCKRGFGKNIKLFQEKKPKKLENRKEHPDFGLPIFAVDQELAETKQLREKYSKEREKTIQKYQRRNLLEVFIENL